MKILKAYLIGALVIYPIMLIWALNDSWTNNTNLHFEVMKLYGFLVIPVLGIHFYQTKKLLSYILFILTAIIGMYLALFPNILTGR